MKRSRQSALVVGLGRFGSAAARRLVELGWDVVGVDLDADVVQDMSDRIGHVVQLDASDEEALNTVGVPDFDVCIVSGASSVESSILLVLNLQHLGARCIIAKAATQHHARILHRLNVDQMVFPERDAGVHLAESLQARNLVEWIDLAEDLELGAVRVPEERVGTTLEQWRELQRPPFKILAHLNAKAEPRKLDPKAELRPGDLIVVVGPLSAMLRLGRKR